MAGQVALAMLVAALTVVGISQAPASADAKASVTAGQQLAPLAAQQAAPAKDVKALASWTCNWTRVGNNVDSSCTVYSGYLRQWAYCSGWGYIYTPWVGAGNWNLWTHCNSYTLTSWGYQSYG